MTTADEMVSELFGPNSRDVERVPKAGAMSFMLVRLHVLPPSLLPSNAVPCPVTSFYQDVDGVQSILRHRKYRVIGFIIDL